MVSSSTMREIPTYLGGHYPQDGSRSRSLADLGRLRSYHHLSARTWVTEMSRCLEPDPLSPQLQRFVRKELVEWNATTEDFGYNPTTDAAYLHRLEASIHLARLLYPRAQEIWKAHRVHFVFGAGEQCFGVRVTSRGNTLECMLGVRTYENSPKALPLLIVAEAAMIGYTGLKRLSTNQERIQIAITVDQANRRLGPLQYPPHDNRMGSYYARETRAHFIDGVRDGTFSAQSTVGDLRAQLRRIMEENIQRYAQRLDEQGLYLDQNPARSYYERHLPYDKPVEMEPHGEAFHAMLTRSGVYTEQGKLWCLPRYRESTQHDGNWNYHTQASNWEPVYAAGKRSSR